ncbi:MAG: N-formylglutamate amidohydrolase [Dokdonella sp.]
MHDDADIVATQHLASLLGPDEQPAFTCRDGNPQSPFVIIGDHASRLIPAALGALGLSEADIDRHIGWDIGIGGVVEHLADQLDAFAIRQNYSRLVVDCNRPLESSTLIAEVSESTTIPGNAGLTQAKRQQRLDEIFWPYHRAIDVELDRRIHAGVPTLFVSMHSFTPTYKGETRPWQLGVLHHRRADVAENALAILRESGEWVVGDNEPYAITLTSEYSIPTHGEGRGLPCVEFEIRQDLIESAIQQQIWAMRFAEWLRTLSKQVL